MLNIRVVTWSLGIFTAVTVHRLRAEWFGGAGVGAPEVAEIAFLLFVLVAVDLAAGVTLLEDVQRRLVGSA